MARREELTDEHWAIIAISAQVVVALEKLRLRIERRPAPGESARLAMQWRDVLPNRPAPVVPRAWSKFA